MTSEAYFAFLPTGFEIVQSGFSWPKCFHTAKVTSQSGFSAPI